ncbi:hypothetical protein [Neisseria leonii]|uniref:hypothetical protein n=1 Tax=Neisseria leonii TaxID=2995413 RepID=UPI00237B08B2|nr:hypothetical protein [Neisseria sp. 3986]MDD9325802.1 hypothetical protein [Neisseria sp. 3986]
MEKEKPEKVSFRELMRMEKEKLEKQERTGKDVLRELLQYMPMGVGSTLVVLSLFTKDIPFGDAVTVFILGFFMTFFLGLRGSNRDLLLAKEAKLKDKAEQLEAERQELETERQKLEAERQELEAERQRLETYVEEARKKDEAMWHKWRDDCEAAWKKWVDNCGASLEERDARNQETITAWEESNAKWRKAVEACEAQIKLLQESLQESENENRALREKIRKYEEFVDTGNDVTAYHEHKAERLKQEMAQEIAQLKQELGETRDKVDILQMKLDQSK